MITTSATHVSTLNSNIVLKFITTHERRDGNCTAFKSYVGRNVLVNRCICYSVSGGSKHLVIMKEFILCGEKQ